MLPRRIKRSVIKLQLVAVLWALMCGVCSLQALAAGAMTFPVTLSEAVVVTGTPRLALNIGGVTRYATYASGSGTSTLSFTYSAQAGDLDLDGITLSSPIDLNGGTIKDLAGNDLASLAFTVPNTSGIKVNYPSLSLDFINNDYILNGTHYASLSAFLTASGGTFSRAGTATYFDSSGTLQTAAANTPRFDYDPVTHAAKGILLEEGRTNLLPNSQSDTGWVSGGTTPPTVQNSQTYLGIACANVTFTAAQTDTGYFGSRATRGTTYASITGGTQYATSLFVSLSRALTGSESIGVYFTGISGLGMSYLTAANSAAYVGQWGRVIMSPVTASGSTTGNDYPTIFLNGVMASPLTVYMSRGQLEVGTFSTSYIPTGASPVSRNSEILTVPTGSWFNASSGAFFAQFQENSALNTGGTSRIMGTSASGRFVYRISGGANYGIFDGSHSAFATAQTQNANVRVSSSYGPAGLAISSNGTTPGTNVFGGTWGDQGYAWIATTFSGYVSSYKYYPAQPTNTQLQLLSQ